MHFCAVHNINIAQVSGYDPVEKLPIREQLYAGKCSPVSSQLRLICSQRNICVFWNVSAADLSVFVFQKSCTVIHLRMFDWLSDWSHSSCLCIYWCFCSWERSQSIYTDVCIHILIVFLLIFVSIQRCDPIWCCRRSSYFYRQALKE